MKLFRKVLGQMLFLAVMLCSITCLRIVITSGSSMEPTYKTGDMLLCIRTFSLPEKGSVIVLEHDGTFVVKRIAYLPGETVPDDVYAYWGNDGVIPDGYVFVAGDNSQTSYDSRYEEFGLVSEDMIWGTIVFQFGGSH